MRTRLLLAGAVISLPASQLGHAAAYAVRFGGRAVELQRSGPHTYYPTALNLSGALVAAALVGGLLLVGGTRVVLGRQAGSRLSPRASLPALIVLMTGLQLATYLGQETAESLAAGYPTPDAASILFWGLAGQLPVGALTAIALYWLSSRVEGALTRLALEARRTRLWPAPALAFAALVAGSHDVCPQPARSIHGERAPPAS